jgi:hypothetical protein
VESGTINEDKLLGIVSKTGADSSKIFKRLIKGFRRLPCFFQPLWTEQMHRKRWYWTYPRRKEPKNEVESEDGLGSVISWHTAINAMDGDAIFRSLLDESGKYKDVPFDKYWYIVKHHILKGFVLLEKQW